MHIAAPGRLGPILIVDDDPDIVEVLGLLLESEGYEVVSARHGALALEALRTGARVASLILLDLMMPVMDGWQLYEQLQRVPELKDIPIVMITADFRAVPRAQALGVAAVLRKPFDADELLAVVRELVPAPAAAQPSGGPAPM